LVFGPFPKDSIIDIFLPTFLGNIRKNICEMCYSVKSSSLFLNKSVTIWRTVFFILKNLWKDNNIEGKRENKI